MAAHLSCRNWQTTQPTHTHAMITPTIHSNGDTAETLTEQYADAAYKVQEAMEALAQCSPDGRNYYPQGPDALTQALEEHAARRITLDGIRQELQELAEYCADFQKKPRNHRKPMFTVRHDYPDGRTERQSFEELDNAIRSANTMPQWEGGETDIFDEQGILLMSRGWTSSLFPLQEDEQPEPGEKLQTEARPTWKAGNHRTEVISDQPTADQMGGADSLKYYGGYLVAESVAPSLVPLISAAPDMRAALESIIEWTDNETNIPHDRLLLLIRNAARTPLEKARGQA